MFYGFSLIWPWNPGALICLIALCLLYALGLRRARSNPARNPQDKPVQAYHIVAFFVGMLLAALVLLTPIDTIGRTQSFIIHIAQVVVLTTVCVPLILIGCPARLLRPVAEQPIVRSILNVLMRPLVASVIFNLVFLLWHAPVIYPIAMANEALYHVEMLSIFLLAFLNWWPILGAVDELHWLSYPAEMLYVFFDGQPVDIFAFVLVFSGTTLYPRYAVPAQLGISAFADQAAGGALLLIPGVIDLIVMTPLFFRWLGQIEERTRQADLRRQAEFEEMEAEEEMEEEDEVVISSTLNIDNQAHG
jgi:cytochrome c oxidase assembly factor CtaG